MVLITVCVLASKFGDKAGVLYARAHLAPFRLPVREVDLMQTTVSYADVVAVLGQYAGEHDHRAVARQPD